MLCPKGILSLCEDPDVLPLSIKTSSAALEKDGFPSSNSNVLLSGQLIGLRGAIIM